MRIRIAAFTQRGVALARNLCAALRDEGEQADVSCPRRLATETGVWAMDDLGSWTARAWNEADALLFVSAAGIATRAIAPCVRDKFTDPAVVCVDEAGAFAISLLSGHVGGANDLARHVAHLCGAQAAVTTATDVRGVFAVDEWAARAGLAIVERDVAKQVSATLLEGAPVGFASDWPVKGALPEGLVDAEAGLVPELGVAVALDASVSPFARTLHLVPRVVTVGMGCRRGTPAERVLAAIDAALAQARVAPQAVRALASIDVKADERGLRDAAAQRGWELRFHSAGELAAVPGSFSSSAFVEQTVGVDNVCERAACAAGERLLLAKQAREGVTVALAAAEPRLSFAEAGPDCASDAAQGENLLTCVGLGPGAGDDLTVRARRALFGAQVIVGYRTYVDLVRDAFPQAEYVTTGMRGEVERCRRALELAAAGRRVAMVCSGDPGVYGMAGLLYELAPAYPGVRIEVIPGVSAANGGAAVLGAPLMHDWCAISLSDLMTPWEAIEARLRAAAQTGLCIALYNPASHGRADHLRRACDVLLAELPGHTVCGLVRNIGREGQTSRVLTLAELRDAQADMRTCVFVGNAQTRVVAGRMVTPRGYQTQEG